MNTPLYPRVRNCFPKVANTRMDSQFPRLQSKFFAADTSHKLILEHFLLPPQLITFKWKCTFLVLGNERTRTKCDTVILFPLPLSYLCSAVAHTARHIVSTQ